MSLNMFLKALPLYSIALGRVIPSLHISNTTNTPKLLGPVSLPTTINIGHVDISVVSFNDEVFDISGVSVFGNVRDQEDVECHPPTHPDKAPRSPNRVLLGPVDFSSIFSALPPGSTLNISGLRMQVWDFHDEVVDISNIGMYGDVVDGGNSTVCPKTSSANSTSIR